MTTLGKTHALLALMALFISACASQERTSYTDHSQHAQMIDGAASRIR